MTGVKGHPASELEDKLDYQFQDAALLQRALTHASVRVSRSPPSAKKSGKSKHKGTAAGARQSLEVRADNERLEFLGDRVLGLVVAELLWQADPLATEGDLARRFNHLVRKEACASVARSLALGDYLILGTSEEDSGGRQKLTILGDAMEGLLGAIFIDGGFEVARSIVREQWAPLIGAMPDEAVDPKSQLQEWAQGQGLPLPRYKELARSGPDHKPLFTAQVEIQGFQAASGQGANKRAAQQAAAEELLRRETGSGAKSTANTKSTGSQER